MKLLKSPRVVEVLQSMAITIGMVRLSTSVLGAGALQPTVMERTSIGQLRLYNTVCTIYV